MPRRRSLLGSRLPDDPLLDGAPHLSCLDGCSGRADEAQAMHGRPGQDAR